MAIERVILWGFMASGKTAVGRGLARRLGWEHLDLDDEIVQRAGKSIARIFSEDGEPAFRALEAEVSRDLLPRRHAVISPGGGWITQPDNLEQIPANTLTVWLRVEPETVLERLRTNKSGPVRPLLQSDDPSGRVRTLLAEREPLYRRADHTVQSDGRTVHSLVAEIAELLSAPDSVSQRRPEISDG